MEIERARPSWKRRLVVIAVAAIGLRAVVITAFRTASPATLDRIRRFNKRTLNPLMLRVAGRAHWYAGCLEHVGRRTGRTHRTPVVAVPVQDGFAVPLPYGTHVDWLRNLLASGTGTLEVKGVRYAVRQPRVLVTDEVLGALPAVWRVILRPYGFEHFLRVVATPVTPGVGAPTDGRSAEPIEARA